LAHGVTFALNRVAHLIFVGADFIISTVIVVSALNFDTCSLFTHVCTGTITSVQAVIVVGTFDWFAIIFFTDKLGINISVEVTGIIHFLPAVFVLAADLIFTFVLKTSVSWTKVGFAIQVGSTLNINTFVSFFESAADLFVTAMFSV